MKVKCISTAVFDTPNSLHYMQITLGEIYEVVEMNEYFYTIIGDDNIKSTFNIECFITIQQLRENKINELLNEQV